jgi:hypothetical protein
MAVKMPSPDAYHPAARRLIQDSRILRSENCCQFDADAETIPPGAVDEQSHSIRVVREPMLTGAYNSLINRGKPRLTTFGRVPIIPRRDDKLRGNVVHL